MYLGFTSATAFSPTDAMPLRAWNKIAMMALVGGARLPGLGVLVSVYILIARPGGRRPVAGGDQPSRPEGATS
jgi:hypothetical protein